MISENCQSSNTIRQSSDESEAHEKSQRQATFPQAIFEADQNYRIEVGEEGISAFPEQSKPFYKLLPSCLWDSFKQKHILYYLVCIILEYFKFCQLEGGEIFGSLVEAILLVFCLFFEVKNRYSTYHNYTSFRPKDNISNYEVWNKKDRKWELTGESELRVGQIIKVERHIEGNPKLNPVNLLPLAFASNKKSIVIKTTRIDKREESMKIKLLKPLTKLVTVIDKDNIEINPKIFAATIQYNFISKLGLTFEAMLSLEQQKVVISNTDTIPRGIGILRQDFVIGVVLRHTQNFQINYALNAITKSNKIDRILSEYLFWIILINSFLLVSVLIINLILTIVTTSFAGSYGEYLYCSIINLASNICNVIYIGTYILIYIHRIHDHNILKAKYKLNFKNSIKTLDELAQTDTLIMDDYFFLDNAFNIDGFDYAFNQDSPLHSSLNIFLRIMEESHLLKEHMLGNTIPINRYFQLNEAKGQKKNVKVKILREILIDDSTIQITIKVIIDEEEERYFVRFSDKPIASTISKIKNAAVKKKVNAMVSSNQNDSFGSLVFFIDLMRIENNQLEIAKSIQYFDFYCLFCFKEESNEKSLKLIKSARVLKKYNVVILSSKAEKYIKFYMKKGGLLKGSDTVIALEEKEEKAMNNIIRNYRKTLRAKEKREEANDKSTILFINSSMITYLSRKNIRKSIFKLSAYCKYIVFYSCSQYEKQISAVNLFKIFPDHIYLTNYICDFNILQYSNLSICERGSSAELLTNIVINSYNNLEGIIFKEAIKSIQIMYCIINSCVFKNQLLIVSHIICFLLVYRGSSIELGVSFVSEVYFFYNFVFTAIPIVFMIIKRPALYIDEDVRQYLNVQRMIQINIRTIAVGAVSSYFMFSIEYNQFAPNVFTSVLINCIITSNIFLLLLDDSYNKKWLVATIFLQIAISLAIIVTVQLLDYQNFQFVELGTNFDTRNIWFYLATFLIIPFLSTLILFALSAGREIKLIENSREIELREWSERVQSGESSESQNYSQIVLKVPPSKGKQFVFAEQSVEILQLM